MIKHFENLPPEEQGRILHACMDEFAEHGYTQASTNTMVKNAGIPKGTLFYFFESKEKLFLYLVDHAVAAYKAFVDQSQEPLPGELFSRLLAMTATRMQFAAHSPGLYRFLFKALLNIPDDLKEEMQQRFADYAKANRVFMREGLDTSNLREGISMEQVLELVGILQEGMLSRYTQALTNMRAEETIAFIEEMLEQTKAQFEMLKWGVYKRP